jgi:hypothetical protein
VRIPAQGAMVSHQSLSHSETPSASGWLFFSPTLQKR